MTDNFFKFVLFLRFLCNDYHGHFKVKVHAHIAIAFDELSMLIVSV